MALIYLLFCDMISDFDYDCVKIQTILLQVHYFSDYANAYSKYDKMKYYVNVGLSIRCILIRKK
jgi:hypothetical protein